MKIDFEINNLFLLDAESLYFDFSQNSKSIEKILFRNILPTVKYYEVSQKVKLINILASTPFLRKENLVALFPSDYDSVSKDNGCTFFFINRFVARFLKYTQPYIKYQKNTNIFNDLIEIEESFLEDAVCNWVSLHEKMHSKGRMPFNTYRKLKSKKFAAAFEELRVDLLVVNELLIKNSDLSNKFARFVLAERLIGYPLHREVFNPDSISSVLLHYFIQKNKGYENNLNILMSIPEICLELEEIEHTVLNAYLRKKDTDILNSFVNDLFFKNKLYESYKSFWRNM